ncbi:unnamed protein product [Closterium sp. NIES-65]|nr:unnamed protein product [Closterium sp. NIES-65]
MTHLLPFPAFLTAFPPHPSSLADLVSNSPAPNLPFALGAASASQVSGIVELSFPPAHNDCLGDATPPPISLPVLAADHVLASGARLHISCHVADVDPSSDARFPNSHPVLVADLANLTRLPTFSHDVCANPVSVAHFPASRLGGDTNLANATHLHAFPHGAGADPANVTRFPALRDAADADPASATRLSASHCDSSTVPASATRLPASRCDSSTDLANAIRLPASHCDTSPVPANATRFPASRHVADVAQANATRLPALRHDAGVDLARSDRFPAFRHSAGADPARVLRRCPVPRLAPAVQERALPCVRFVSCLFRQSLPPRLPWWGLPPLLPRACRAARLRPPPGLRRQHQPRRHAQIPATSPCARPLLLQR